MCLPISMRGAVGARSRQAIQEDPTAPPSIISIQKQGYYLTMRYILSTKQDMFTMAKIAIHPTGGITRVNWKA